MVVYDRRCFSWIYKRATPDVNLEYKEFPVVCVEFVISVSKRLDKKLVRGPIIHPCFDLQNDMQFASFKRRLIPNGDECLHLVPRTSRELRVIYSPSCSCAEYTTDGEWCHGNARAHCTEPLTRKTSRDSEILQEAGPVCLLNAMFLK